MVIKTKKTIPHKQKLPINKKDCKWTKRLSETHDPGIPMGSPVVAPLGLPGGRPLVLAGEEGGDSVVLGLLGVLTSGEGEEREGREKREGGEEREEREGKGRRGRREKED